MPRHVRLVMRWNPNKKHRCPLCHTIAIDMEDPKSWAVYECCNCHTSFARWPRLASWVPFRGVKCSEHAE